jgi:hypothetical protein
MFVVRLPQRRTANKPKKIKEILAVILGTTNTSPLPQHTTTLTPLLHATTSEWKTLRRRDGGCRRAGVEDVVAPWGQDAAL